MDLISPARFSRPFVARSSSDGVVTRFAGADAHDLFYVGDENLPVADAAGLSRGDDGLDGFFHHLIAENEFELHLRQEIHHIFGPAIKLGVTLLAAEALGFGHGDALQS